MFREPLRRDPLVVGWALCLLLAAAVALATDTPWRGHLAADRFSTFIGQGLLAVAWSVGVLVLLAWLRASGLLRAEHAEAREAPAEPTSAACRHGVSEATTLPDQAPVLRALSVSQNIVRPGASVTVSWCFEHADDVLVDGRRGYRSCGEAQVRVTQTRSIGVIGRNGSARTEAATSTVVTTALPELHAPAGTPAPEAAVRIDVSATIGSPVAARLPALWAAADRRRSRAALLVGTDPGRATART